MKTQAAIIFAVLILSAGDSSAAKNYKWLEAKSSDNMSMMDYADKNDARLSKLAKSREVNPNFSSWAALYVYYMPDGKTVECTRGILYDTFMYECKEF